MSRTAIRAEVRYGWLERRLHDLAFASIDMQRALGEIESRIHAGRIDLRYARRPVFVTSLPRAGTTMMLNLLASVREFATATYRHMPFPLAPLLWSGVSRRFQRAGEVTERAHGDGIEVSVDSPEAFEELLWMAFWPEHYGPTAIRPWSRDAERDGFHDFMRRHMAKIVIAKGSAAERYLSKNNANIARLGLIERLFPDATVIVPVRNPWAQVASLMRQHRRFNDIHHREPFARRYMEDLGHFEFGAALRPITFTRTAPDPARAGGPEFWLTYWCDAYEAVLRVVGRRTVLIDHDALSRDPAAYLPAIAMAFGVDRPDVLAAAADRFRPPARIQPPDAPAALLRRAADIHARLVDRALPARGRFGEVA